MPYLISQTSILFISIIYSTYIHTSVYSYSSCIGKQELLQINASIVKKMRIYIHLFLNTICNAVIKCLYVHLPDKNSSNKICSAGTGNLFLTIYCRVENLSRFRIAAVFILQLQGALIPEPSVYRMQYAYVCIYVCIYVCRTYSCICLCAYE